MAERPKDLPPDVRHEGDPQGATVYYHPTRHVNGHFNNLWEFVPHGVPDGFRFEKGELVPKTAEAAASAPPATAPAAPIAATAAVREITAGVSGGGTEK